MGQGFFFANRDVLLYGMLVFVVFYTFVWFYEEPILRRRYGPQYAAYCAHVGRWLPRWRAWKPPA